MQDPNPENNELLEILYTGNNKQPCVKWTEIEIYKLHEALRAFGKDYEKIQQIVESKTYAQVYHKVHNMKDTLQHNPKAEDADLFEIVNQHIST